VKFVTFVIERLEVFPVEKKLDVVQSSDLLSETVRDLLLLSERLGLIFFFSRLFVR
jgi:hypothetical protein